jgi:hypothetical protein
VSRLLAENLGFREQILRLQTEAECSKTQQVVDHMSRIKADLEVKLSELGALVTTLGEAPSKKKQLPKRKCQIASPTQKNWERLRSQNESADGQDGRLPPIVENKSYPRRTLE